MGRIAELLEHPRHHLGVHMPHAFSHRPKSSIGGIVILALAVAGLVWMWPEIQRYMKMRQM